MTHATDEQFERLQNYAMFSTGPEVRGVFQYAVSEIERLRTMVLSVNRIISQNEPYRWKVERIVAALDSPDTRP